MKYIYKFPNMPTALPTDITDVYNPPFYKKEGEFNVPIFGSVATYSSTRKKDKSKIVVKGNGIGMATLEASRDDINKSLRRIRPQEAAKIAEIDAEIARLIERRKGLYKTAWQKAHTVTVKELTDMIGE